MNQKLIVKIVGLILCIEALCMLAPLAVSLLFSSGDTRAFLLSLAICGGTGALLSRVKSGDHRLQTRDGFVCVALCWLALSVFGALPYLFCGLSPADAFFETVSGLTTTGASILPSPSSMSAGLLFWRALTQWLGGMGILVMVLALLPRIGEGSINLMRAESPGPIISKLSPKTSETARILYTIYIALTAAEILLLRLAGMPWFDSITTALTTLSTGGFSIRDASIAFYQSELINWIVVLFMFLAAINFSVLFLFVQRRFKEALKSEELRMYVLLVLGVIGLITANLVVGTGAGLYTAFSQAAFQVVTLVSTTGYCTADFALWPTFSQALLILVMFSGGCAGSTSGGIKISRILVLFKTLRRDLRRILHSREVHPITLDGARVEEDTVLSVSSFFFVYIVILLFCTVLVSLDGISFDAAFSAALSAISNVGPALSELGPTQNYAFLSGLSKYALSVAMLLGRLEIMPLLVLFFPSVWRRK